MKQPDGRIALFQNAPLGRGIIKLHSHRMRCREKPRARVAAYVAACRTTEYPLGHQSPIVHVVEFAYTMT